ncbi:MAG TPA: PepSY domain-containing protein [Methanobacterium sp.]|nr:MAG: PepSY domain-containing protein [Methanobacterium sp.]HOI71449.1 PepSY domain-containing protein [Methanobacterium sp.]
MDLPEDWEKKALIVVGAIFILTVIYSFNPFVGTPANNTTMEEAPNGPTIIPFPENERKNDTDNNSTDSKITEDDAKRIAEQAYPDYTVGTPSQGSINVNDTTYFVWIVPLTKDNSASKTIYIDVDNGNIVKEY